MNEEFIKGWDKAIEMAIDKIGYMVRNKLIMSEENIVKYLTGMKTKRIKV